MSLDCLRTLKRKTWGCYTRRENFISTLALGSSQFFSLLGRPETKKDESDHTSSSSKKTTISIEGIGVDFPHGLNSEDNSIPDKGRVTRSIDHAISQARKMAGRKKTAPDGVSLFLSVHGSALTPRRLEPLNTGSQGLLSTSEENQIYVNQLMDNSITEEIIHCIRSLGAEIKDVVFEPFGVGKAILTPEEEASQVAIIDIGKRFTDLTMFNQGNINYFNSIQRAGKDIDRAIGKFFEIELWEAEYLKQEVGTLNIISTDIELIKVHSRNDKYPETINPATVARIIRSEVKSILDIIFTNLVQNRTLPERVVLTGNSSLLEDLITFVEDHYGVQARREGVPSGFSGLAYLLDEPRYHSSFGLLRYGLEYKKGEKKE